MQALGVQPNLLGPEHVGGVITRDQPTQVGTFRKGHRITGEDLEALRTSDQPIHVVLLEDGDITESEAVPRLAEGVRGGNTTQTDIVQGRVNIRSARRGLLKIDQAQVDALNMHPEIGVFTAYDGQAVNANQVIAGVKIGPVAVPSDVIDAALATIAPPIIDVIPFASLRVTCVVSETLDGRVRDRFEQGLHRKIAWYGGKLLNITYVTDNVDALSNALSSAVSEADIVLTAGSHMMDPLDATIEAVHRNNGNLVRLGAPAHPGSMVWLAYVGDTPVLSLAGCSMFSRSTVADLLLPFLYARVAVSAEHFAALGYGGLLDRHMDWRFPPYEVEE